MPRKKRKLADAILSKVTMILLALGKALIKHMNKPPPAWVKEDPKFYAWTDSNKPKKSAFETEDKGVEWGW